VPSGVLFLAGANFRSWRPKKMEMEVNLKQRAFFGGKKDRSFHFERKKFLKPSFYLGNKLQPVMWPKYGRNPSLVFLLSFRTCSQIWVIPFVYDSQPNYLTNLGKQTLVAPSAFSQFFFCPFKLGQGKEWQTLNKSNKFNATSGSTQLEDYVPKSSLAQAKNNDEQF